MNTSRESKLANAISYRAQQESIERGRNRLMLVAKDISHVLNFVGEHDHNLLWLLGTLQEVTTAQTPITAHSDFQMCAGKSNNTKRRIIEH